MEQRCPSCSDGGYIADCLIGAYCKKCGLILSSYSVKNVKVQGPRRLRKCQACKELVLAQQHHVIPKRVGVRSHKIWLCDRCHRLAHLIIDNYYPKKFDLR